MSENRAPIVTVTFPNGGEILNGTQTITWTAVDYDSDPLVFSLSYSEDGGSHWNSLVSGLTSTSYDWNTSLYEDGEEYLIRVTASDGVLTGSDQSNAVFELDNIADITTGGEFYIDPAQLAIIGAVVLVIIIIIVAVVMMKRKKS